MKTDIEIARSVEMRKITDIAESIGIPEEKIDQYGRYIAKVSRQLVDEEKVKKSKLILVTAITATKAGIGKTTVSVGLALGLNTIGKNAIVALVVADYEAGKKDGLDEKALEKLIDENVLALNPELAAYSKIGYTEIRRDAFEKTPKQSIKRFMYS